MAFRAYRHRLSGVSEFGRSPFQRKVHDLAGQADSSPPLPLAESFENIMIEPCTAYSNLKVL